MTVPGKMFCTKLLIMQREHAILLQFHFKSITVAKDVFMFIMKKTQGMIKVIFSSLKLQISLNFLDRVMKREGAATVSELSDKELQAPGSALPLADCRPMP